MGRSQKVFRTIKKARIVNTKSRKNVASTDEVRCATPPSVSRQKVQNDLSAYSEEQNASCSGFRIIDLALLSEAINLCCCAYCGKKVGAGTAGSVVASRLASDAKSPSVLVIEAGDFFPWWSSIPLAAPLLQDTAYDWAYRTVPQLFSSWGLHNETSAWPRGKGLGGTGQINYLVHFPGSQEDFESWEKMGANGWSYDSIKIFMKQLMGESLEDSTYLHNDFQCVYTYEKLLTTLANKTCCKKKKLEMIQLHITSVNPDENELARACVEGGEELSQSENISLFFRPAESTTLHGHRWSSFDGFLKPLRGKPNLHISPNTLATKILFSDDLKAKGLEIIDSFGERRTVFSDSEIILSAGAVNTPQLLLLSGIGPRQHLEETGIPVVADLPVGLNLHDHLNLPLFVSISEPVSVTIEKVLQVSELYQYAWHGKGLLASTGIAGVGSNNQNIGIVLFGLGSVHEKILRRVANYKLNAFKALFPFNQNTSQEGFVLLATCLKPLSRGFISLQNQDPNIPPLIDPQYLTHHKDLKCMANAVKMSAQLVNTKAFQDLGAILHLPNLDECRHVVPDLENDIYIECLLRTAAITGYHPGGSCKMGDPSDSSSVVDPYLRVRGISGLRVIDASIFPSPISGHPNSVVIAVAEMATSLIINNSHR